MQNCILFVFLVLSWSSVKLPGVVFLFSPSALYDSEVHNGDTLVIIIPVLVVGALSEQSGSLPPNLNSVPSSSAALRILLWPPAGQLGELVATWSWDARPGSVPLSMP